MNTIYQIYEYIYIYIYGTPPRQETPNNRVIPVIRRPLFLIFERCCTVYILGDGSWWFHGQTES